MKEADLNQACASLLSAIAISFERVNAFACELRRNDRFRLATTGTDIRVYANGWKFEKYIEAICGGGDTDKYAVWWLELSFNGNNWKIDSSVHITNGSYRHDFPSRTAENPQEFVKELELAVGDLERSCKGSTPFSRAIEAEYAVGVRP